MAGSPCNWEDIAKEAALVSELISEDQVDDSLLSDTEPSFLVALSPDSPSGVCTQVILKESMASQNIKTPLKDSTNTHKTVGKNVKMAQSNMNVTPQKSVESQESSSLYCPSSAEFQEFMANIMNVTPLTEDCESTGSSNSTIIRADDENRNENVSMDIKDRCKPGNKKQSQSRVRKGTFDLDKPLNEVMVPEVINGEEKSQKEKMIKEPNLTETTRAKEEDIEDLEKFLGAEKKEDELLPSPPSLSDVPDIGPVFENNIEKSFGSFSDVNPVVEDLLGKMKGQGHELLSPLASPSYADPVSKPTNKDTKTLTSAVSSDLPECDESKMRLGNAAAKQADVSVDLETDCQDVFDHKKCLTVEKEEKYENRLIEIDAGIADHLQNLDMAIASSNNGPKASEKGSRKLVQPSKIRRSVSDLSINASSKTAPRKSTSGLPMKAPNTRLPLMKPGQIQSKLQLKRPSVGSVTGKPHTRGRQDETVTKVDSLKVGDSSILSKTITKSQQDAPSSRLVPSNSFLQPKPTVQTKDTKPQIKPLGKLAEQFNGKGKISLLPNGPKIIMKAPGQKTVRTPFNEDNSKTVTKVFRRPSLKMIQPPSTRTAANKTNGNIQGKQASDLVTESNTTGGQVTSSPPCQLSIPIIDGSKTVTKEPNDQLKKARGPDQSVAPQDGGKTVTYTKAGIKKGPAPVKALIPIAGSSTITKEPSQNGSRTVTKSSSTESFTTSTDASLDTPMKSDRFLIPKRLSNVFHTPKKISENGESGTKKSSFIPTPTRLNRNSSDSSTGSTPGRGFRKPSFLAGNGSSPFPGSQSGGEDFDAFKPRRALVQNTPEVEPRRQSMWSPVKKYTGVSAEDMAFQCTKGVRGGRNNSLI